MNLVVTGGTGFIGRHVVSYAEGRGMKVWTVDRLNGQDILDPDLPAYIEGADAVIHLAGLLGTHELFDEAERAIEVNTVGTLRVLEACRAVGAGYVGLTMPDVFPSVYTATKVAAQRLASAWHHSYGVPVAHVRAYNAYGVGQAHGPGHPQKIIPTFAYEAWRGRPLPVWGSGDQTVDLICATQLARLLVRATERGADEVIDGGTGVAWSVLNVAKAVGEIAHPGEETEVEHLPMRRGEVPTHVVAEGRGWEHVGRPEFCYPCLQETVASFRP